MTKFDRIKNKIKLKLNHLTKIIDTNELKNM